MESPRFVEGTPGMRIRGAGERVHDPLLCCRAYRSKYGWVRPWLRPRPVPVIGASDLDRPWRVVCGAAHTAVLCVGGRVYVLSARAYAPSPIQSAMISPIQSAVLSSIQNVSEGHAGYPGKPALLSL